MLGDSRKCEELVLKWERAGDGMLHFLEGLEKIDGPLTINKTLIDSYRNSLLQLKGESEKVVRKTLREKKYRGKGKGKENEEKSDWKEEILEGIQKVKEENKVSEEVSTAFEKALVTVLPLYSSPNKEIYRFDLWAVTNFLSLFSKFYLGDSQIGVSLEKTERVEPRIVITYQFPEETRDYGIKLDSGNKILLKEGALLPDLTYEELLETLRFLEVVIKDSSYDGLRRLVTERLALFSNAK